MALADRFKSARSPDDAILIYGVVLAEALDHLRAVLRETHVLSESTGRRCPTCRKWTSLKHEMEHTIGCPREAAERFVKEME